MSVTPLRGAQSPAESPAESRADSHDRGNERVAADAHATPAIELAALHKVYDTGRGKPGKEALRSVDLSIGHGELFGLLGPNGAGKSTLINILAGLVIKTSGKARICGFDIDVNPRNARAAIGVVPQELSIDPFFTPRESLDLQAGLYGVPKRERRTETILRDLFLTEVADAYSRRLSGGMKRRLMVAKAMVHAPPVIVLDEPTAGVDVELRQYLWAYIRGLNAAPIISFRSAHRSKSNLIFRITVWRTRLNICSTGMPGTAIASARASVYGLLAPVESGATSPGPVANAIRVSRAEFMGARPRLTARKPCEYGLLREASRITKFKRLLANAIWPSTLSALTASESTSGSRLMLAPMGIK